MYPTASMLGDAYAGSVSAPFDCKAPFFAEETDCLSASSAKEGSCAKGFLVAIGLEVVMTFCFFGICHFWHIIR